MSGGHECLAVPVDRRPRWLTLSSEGRRTLSKTMRTAPPYDDRLNRRGAVCRPWQFAPQVGERHRRVTPRAT
jgi:hypothetical protein